MLLSYRRTDVRLLRAEGRGISSDALVLSSLERVLKLPHLEDWTYRPVTTGTELYLIGTHMTHHITYICWVATCPSFIWKIECRRSQEAISPPLWIGTFYGDQKNKETLLNPIKRKMNSGNLGILYLAQVHLGSRVKSINTSPAICPLSNLSSATGTWTGTSTDAWSPAEPC